jgi:hypothetical protein
MLNLRNAGVMLARCLQPKVLSPARYVSQKGDAECAWPHEAHGACAWTAMNFAGIATAHTYHPFRAPPQAINPLAHCQDCARLGTPRAEPWPCVSPVAFCHPLTHTSLLWASSFLLCLTCARCAHHALKSSLFCELELVARELRKSPKRRQPQSN